MRILSIVEYCSLRKPFSAHFSGKKRKLGLSDHLAATIHTVRAVTNITEVAKDFIIKKNVSHLLQKC
jgi:hypothetical protein